MLDVLLVVVVSGPNAGAAIPGNQIGGTSSPYLVCKRGKVLTLDGAPYAGGGEVRAVRRAPREIVEYVLQAFAATGAESAA